MNVLASLLGIGLIVFALVDIFKLLFHPTGQGLNQRLSHAVWQVFRRFATRKPSRLVWAGPIAFFIVLAAWIILLVVGWALIYWPRLPDEFNFDIGLDPSGHTDFLDALYLSLVTMGTLGYGDITPLFGAVRMLAPLQAIVGFGLLTASISWLVSIFSALNRRKALADSISHVRKAELKTGIAVTKLSSDTAQQILGESASRLDEVRFDLVLFPITYYFHNQDGQTELSGVMPELLELAERASSEGYPPEVRLRAAMLREAIDGFALTVTSQFLGLSSATTEEILDAYAHDHLQVAADKD